MDTSEITDGTDQGFHSAESNVVRYGADLDADHPGFADQGYRDRRQRISEVASAYSRGGPIPHAPYSDDEHGVWATCYRELSPKHEALAFSGFMEGKRLLDLPPDHVPQLDEVGALLHPVAGFRYEPVAGLVSPRVFYESLGDGWFPSTQYIRHASVPYYTPEPDVIHEVIGHANQIASPGMAELYRKVGRAVRRCRSDEAVDFLSRVFWFTIEFGVLWEDGELKAYGAGILSSFGELDAFRDAEIRPVDWLEMGTREYDITHYQPVLFAFDSHAHLTEAFGDFLDTFDDAAHKELVHNGTTHAA